MITFNNTQVKILISIIVHRLHQDTIASHLVSYLQCFKSCIKEVLHINPN